MILRTTVTRGRHTAAVRAADRVAVVIRNAVENQYNWEFDLNGESLTLERALSEHSGEVFDVGANVGQWAKQALPRLNGRSLHCFEAVPAIFRQLQTNLAGDPRVRINNQALGNEIGEIDFDYCHESPEVSSRYTSAWYQRTMVERVTARVTTGDDYCTASGIDRIAMLKVDVEGMEYEVLAGFKTMLQNRRISVVQFEYGLGYIGARRYLKDVCELLTGFGYDVFRQFPDGLESYAYREADEDFRARNYVAIAKEGTAAPLVSDGHHIATSVGSSA